MDDETLTQILERFWRWRLDGSPEFATAVGDHERDAELDDHSLSAYAKRLQDAKDFVAELDKLDKNKLNKDNQLNFELLHLELTTFIDGSVYNCKLFPVSCLEGPQLEFSRVISWMKQEKYSDFEKILSRYDKFPKQVEQFIELLKKGVETGYVNAKISMQAVPGQITALVEKPADKSKFFEPFVELPEALSNKQRDLLQTRALKAISDKLYPAFKNLLNYIKESYIPACRDEIACASLPSGKAFYEAALRFHISTDMSADEVYSLGIKEVERIQGRMLQVMKEAGFKGTLEEFLKFLRTDPQFYFNNKDDFLGSYRNICSEIDKLLPGYFETLPKSEYVIKETPPEGAANAPGAFYLAGSQDGSRPGTFFVNTHKFQKRPNYEFRALSLHEAVPGHHMQISIGMEQKNLPSFRKFFEDRRYYKVPERFSLYGAYMEGWGLYSEFLGEEMKVYKTPYDLFGRLSTEIFRACRLVVDPGMHVKGWTRQEAVDYMSKNTAMGLHDITAEVDRYIIWPGQACSYKIGEIKIRELRDKAHRELGEKFDLRLFHDAVLLPSAVPIEVLERNIHRFIEGHQ